MAKESLKDYYFRIREKNEKIRESRMREIYSKIPEMLEIDFEMRQLGLSLAMKAFDKDDEDVDIFIEQSKQKLENLKLRRAVVLTDNNFPPDYLDEIFDCRECKDRGFIDNIPCKCYKENKIKVLNSLKIWEKLKKENFDSFDYTLYSDEVLPDFHPLKSRKTPSLRVYMKIVVRLLKEFVDSVGPVGVYLYGETGVGKTFLCSCIAQYALEKGKDLEYYSMNTLYEVLRKYKFDLDVKDVESIQAYKNLFGCDILIIDDLGSEMKNSFVTSELFSIINDRMVAGKKTVISSNIVPEDIGEYYGERIASRVIGTYSVHLIDGLDLRQK